MTEIIYNLFYGQPLYRIIVIMILLMITWRCLDHYFGKQANKLLLWRILNVMICLGMLVVILMITISSRVVGTSEVVWIPFYSFVEAQEQPEMYRSMLMNAFMFFPLGLTLPYALPDKWKHQVLLAILFALGLSVTIEFLQYYFCLGRAETDDVICNTFGCAIGTVSYQFGRNFGKKFEVFRGH